MEGWLVFQSEEGLFSLGVTFLGLSLSWGVFVEGSLVVLKVVKASLGSFMLF